MEQSTSKIGINILIVIAIVLIGASLTTVFIKKPVAVEVIKMATSTEQRGAQELAASSTSTPSETAISTTTASTTTEVVATSTKITTSTSTSIKGFTEKKWTWIKTITGSKTITPKKTTAFTLTFNTDKSLKGTTDCNSFFGSYKIASTTLSFGLLGATQMFCEGAQEGDFMKSLQGVKGYSIDTTNTLILTTGSSSILFK